MNFHVASFIVRTRPEVAATLAARIAAVPANEIHAVDAGKIIVVVESTSEGALADRMDEIRNDPDVLMVSMVYHQVDHEAEPSGEIT